jgi:hypothetical protein
VGRFRVEHGVIAVGVEQNFVEAVEHAVDVEQPAASASMACSRRVVVRGGVSAETSGAVVFRAELFRAGRFFDVSSACGVRSFRRIVL